MAPEEPLPAMCAECVTTTQAALPGAPAKQEPSRVFRGADGKTRVDAGDMSVITDPAKEQTVMLDHVKKVAQIFPKPPDMPAPPPIPGAPPAPPMPPSKPPQFNVEELGKGFIEGHEVEGKRYIIQPEPPQLPKPPEMPKPPALPPKPGMPAVPQAAPPPIPPPPPAPTVAEVWTSTSLKTPVLTKVKGDFGEQITHCKPTAAPPPPAAFEIPADYKQVVAATQAPPPKPPIPAMPKAEVPKPPALPTPPKTPAAPKVPGFGS